MHRDVCMECWLLPCTLSAELQEETPLVEEQRKLQMLHMAARRIQRWWRAKKMMIYLRDTGMIRPGATTLTRNPCSTGAALQHATPSLIPTNVSQPMYHEDDASAAPNMLVCWHADTQFHMQTWQGMTAATVHPTPRGVP